MKNKEEYKRIGAKLRYLRQAAGLTQREVAKGLEIHRSTVGLIEIGKRGMSIKRLYKFADFFDVDPASILESR